MLTSALAINSILATRILTSVSHPATQTQAGSGYHSTMKVAEGKPVENGDSSQRYWFPKALAKFYIPLPDPLPIRDGYTYIWSFPIWPWQLEENEAAGAVEVGDRWLERIAAYAATFVTVDEQERRPLAQVSAAAAPRIDPSRPHAGLSAFGSAIRLWMGTDTGIVFPSLKSVAVASRRSEGLKKGAPLLDSDELSTHLTQEIDSTVAEVVVPFHCGPDEDQEDAATNSFNNAIRVIQNLQESLYQIRRYPIREVTKELCPPFVPFLTGMVTSAETPHDFPVEGWTKHSMMLHMNSWDYGRPSVLTDEEHQQFDEALWTRLKNRPFTSSLELRRSATVALERTGDYRASIVWTAAQAEAIFDQLLRHLMWEEGRLPERSLQEFQALSVANRVRTHYEHRLGGSWDLKTPGAITDWKVQVADVRNRVVHDHFRPTWTQAHDALLAVDSLISCIGDLLVQRLGRYFRTAMQLIGTSGLQKRGALERFHECARNAYPLDWTSTFGRWQSTHRLLLGEPRVLDLSRSVLYFVHGRRNRGYWLVVDASTNLAARVLVNESTIDPTVLNAINLFIEAPQETNQERALSMLMDVEPRIIRLIDKPREMYHLLPMYGVRVGGGDIADTEFIWRPKHEGLPATEESPS